MAVYNYEYDGTNGGAYTGINNLDGNGTSDTINISFTDDFAAPDYLWVGVFMKGSDGEIDVVNFELPYGWTTVLYSSSVDYASTEMPGAYSAYYYVYDADGTRVAYLAADQVNGLTITNRAATPCFIQGTLIVSKDGQERLVEDLRAGDLVKTRDNGLQRIRWIGNTVVDQDVLEQFPGRYPVRIAAGTFGNVRDTFVSQQHRILVTDPEITKHYGGNEVLVPAKALVDGDRIRVDDTVDSVSYYHILFDKHEVICSDGAWSESFKPGKWIMDEMNTATRDEVIALFPQLEVDPDNYSPAARKLVRPGQLRKKIREDVYVHGLNENRECLSV